jgi:hypothetical protein
MYITAVATKSILYNQVHVGTLLITEQSNKQKHRRQRYLVVVVLTPPPSKWSKWLLIPSLLWSFSLKEMILSAFTWASFLLSAS